MTNKEIATSFMKRVMASDTVSKACKYMACTFVESDSDITEHQLQLPLKSVVQPPPDMKSEIDVALTDLVVVTNSNDDEIVDNLLTEWSNTVQLQMFKAVELPF